MPTYSESSWKQKIPPNNIDVEKLIADWKLPPLYAVLLANRGIADLEEAKSFVNLTIHQLLDPFLMDGMQLAFERILTAIEQGERIMVYGDYDVDGTTGVSLFYLFLTKAYDKVEFYIPDRYAEGYGISKLGIDTAKLNNCTLIVAIDCGIRSVDLVDYANSINIDFIICDHHLPGKTLPEAIAVLDPKKPNCTFPFKELSGCGIAFKLAQALNQSSDLWPADYFLEFIDLAAVSTCCDIVPMVGENRILVDAGLEKLNTNPRLGLKTLLYGADNQAHQPLSVTDIVFKIGPRINAAGRIKSARSAVELLISDDFNLAKEYSTALNDLNSQRGVLDRDITEEAFALIGKETDFDNQFTTVVYSPHWHKGVVGIVASRLIEKYYRPTLVLTDADDLIGGSARSIDKVDVHEALTECADLLTQFGGHSHAAGLKLKPENLAAFKLRFDEAVSKMITREDLNPIYWYETEWGIELVNEKLLENIQRFSPFGPQNMEPVFLAKGVYDTGLGRTMGKDHDHLRLNLVSAKRNDPITAIGFKLGQHYNKINTGKPFNMLYTVGLNYYNGISSLQIEIKDIKFEA
jgi:single-stranded-DNA-specific exonuclease